jgi:hypothetical protein
MAACSSDPPQDPEAWTDEQWIEWLKATDPDPTEESQEVPQKSFRTRALGSSGGVVLGAAMTAVANIIYEPKDPDAVIVAQAPDEPEDPDVNVVLDLEHPERSVARIRRDETPPQTPR